MSGEAIFITTGKPSALAACPASGADAAVAALGSAIPQAAHRALHSPGERTLRRLALAVSITSRTAERS
jgi:hypothetical protein